MRNLGYKANITQQGNFLSILNKGISKHGLRLSPNTAMCASLIYLPIRSKSWVANGHEKKQNLQPVNVLLLSLTHPARKYESPIKHYWTYNNSYIQRSRAFSALNALLSIIFDNSACIMAHGPNIKAKLGK